MNYTKLASIIDLVNSEIIYLDHAAATPVDGKVLRAMEPYFSDKFYNPSSPYTQAIDVKRDYRQAKNTIGRLIGASGDDIIITAGATESINLAIRSIGGHIITANTEHRSVTDTAKQFDHTIVSVDSRGTVDPTSIQRAIRPDTRLVSVALANNEIGTIQPLREIATIIRTERQRRLSQGDRTPIYLHSDASQGVGQIDVHVSRLGIDMLTMNSSKIYGPKQVGLLWADSSVRLTPQITGGGQERGLRSGTENVAGAIGFAKALELVTEHRDFEQKRLRAIRDFMQKDLTDRFPQAIISGHPKSRLSGHLHISFPGLDAERLLFALESRGVLVATGSACAANKGTRSHILEAIGLPPEVADGSLRITLGHLTNQDNAQRAVKIITEVVEREYERVSRR